MRDNSKDAPEDRAPTVAISKFQWDHVQNELNAARAEIESLRGAPVVAGELTPQLREIIDDIIHHKIGVDPLEGAQARCGHQWKNQGDDDECLKCGTFYTPVIVTELRDFILARLESAPVEGGQ